MKVWDLEYGVEGFRAWGSAFRMSGLRLEAQGLGFRVGGKALQAVLLAYSLTCGIRELGARLFLEAWRQTP